MSIDGRCHCGACTVRLPRLPDSVTECNCSLCRATGFRGVYFRSDEIEIAGDFDSYVRSDIGEAFLRNFRCSNCGMATHWEPLTAPPHERMGVNANMLDPTAIAGLPVRHVDGASW
ncbi:GFA family protein [Sphingomonas lutea]|uniref:GFA family protein n=1 Tax=Sphingomonas lutea TaxID=1045317 RepID=A0A7G9SIV6_9SPHN|nr:GFA family protein [Sphingomonas lutea]QNN67781.1 GFA family protein [Sphingomonas lutea]